ncbi:MAG: hypothetical protein JWQ96_154 [Segetibacter sp.]|nr:hypothetical protein [Segetibacter sp.]
MLVDDDEDDQMIFTKVINEINSNINCKCFGNALSTLQTLRTNIYDKPDCIYLDLNLPLMHSFEFQKIIKTSEELNNIPVIIYSTSSREADKVKAMELGAINFISKTTTFADLKNKVTNLLPTVCCSGN